MQNHTKGILYASITALLWGFLAIALKVAVKEVNPHTIVWFRFVIAFVILSFWHAVYKPKELKILIRPPWLLVLAAIALSWNYLGFMLGIQYTTPSNAQLFIQSGPITLAIIGIIVFKEKLRSSQIVGFIIAIVGLVFFYNQQIQVFIGAELSYSKGVLFTLSGAMAWATYAALQKKLVQKIPGSTLNLFLFGFPALVYLPFVDLSPFFHLSFGWWLLMVFLGLNTLVAYTFLAKALEHTEANKVSIIIILNPLITFTVMGLLTKLNVSWIDGERFTFLSILGAAILLFGAILVVGKKRK